MVIEKIGYDHIVVSIDLSRHIGILNFTHELSIWFYINDKLLKPEFINADEITPDGWITYDSKEELEEIYPNIINDILSSNEFKEI